MIVEKETFYVRGKAHFVEVYKPRLNKHDETKTKMQYRVMLAFDNENDPELKKAEANFKKFKVKTKVIDEFNQETGEDTGRKLISFLKRAFYDEAGNVQNPPIVADKYGEPTKELIGNGSEILVGYTVREYTAPGSKRTDFTTELKGVQIINLIKYTPPEEKKQTLFKPLVSKEESIEVDNTVPF